MTIRRTTGRRTASPLTAQLGVMAFVLGFVSRRRCLSRDIALKTAGTGAMPGHDCGVAQHRFTHEPGPGGIDASHDTHRTQRGIADDPIDYSSLPR